MTGVEVEASGVVEAQVPQELSGLLVTIAEVLGVLAGGVVETQVPHELSGLLVTISGALVVLAGRVVEAQVPHEDEGVVTATGVVLVKGIGVDFSVQGDDHFPQPPSGFDESPWLPQFPQPPSPDFC